MYGNIIIKPPRRQSKIVNAIVSDITSGRFAPGTQLPSTKKLRETFDASPVTVSHAVSYLRQHGFVRTEHRKGVFVADNPSCFCNIGLVLPHINAESNLFTAFRNEAEFISKETASDGMKRRFRRYQMVNCAKDEIRSHHRELFAAVEADTFTGLIFLGETHEILTLVRELNPRIACVNFRYKASPGSIHVHYGRFLEKAMDITVANGRKRVAVLTCQPYKEETYSHILECASRRDLFINSMWIQRVGPEWPKWASNNAELLLAHGKGKIDTLIIDDDNIVPAATEGVAASGVRVPDDVLVVAHANFPHTTASAVPAIRMGWNVRQAMHLAVTLIEKQRMGQEVPNSILMETQLQEELAL